MPKYNTITFIEKAKQIHGDKYDYSLVDYKTIKTKVKIICPIHGVFEQTPEKHMNGQGCKGCANDLMREQRRDKNFIEKAKKIHGDKFDYSDTEYVNLRTNIKFKCNKCGRIIEQKPENHLLKSYNCPCSRTTPKRRNTASFIEEANLVHNNKYNYSLVDYKNFTKEVKIICPVHGVFEQLPGNHLNGCGCPKCANHKERTTEEFIEESKLIHGERYDYSKAEFTGTKRHITIICPKHGEFKQKAGLHLGGGGCPKCAAEENGKRQSFTNEEFIAKSKKIHGNKYDYSKTNYISTHKEVTIICPIHGEFSQLAYYHLSGSGCPNCSNSIGEEKIRSFLLEKNINFIPHKSFDDLKDVKLLSYDFYIEEKNLLIEYNGIQHYSWQRHFQPTYHDFLIQKHHDWLKRKYCKKNNINLLVISYEEDIEECLKKIL